MSEITDQFMHEMLGKSRPFTAVVLKKGPNYRSDGDRSVVWEHGRRNFELRAAGKLAIVMPVMDESEVAGLGIFTTGAEETAALMAEDPAVKAGWFTFETHTGRSFPGDGLPG